MGVGRLELSRHLDTGCTASDHQDGLGLLDLQNRTPPDPSVSRMTSLAVGVALVTTTHLLDQVVVGLDGVLQ